MFQWFKHDAQRFFYSVKSAPFSPFYLLPGVSPVLLHYGMFVTAIEMLGSDEQGEIWLPRARKMAILGCYA